MAANPAFFGTPIKGYATFAVANTANDGTGTLQALTWVGTSGGAPQNGWLLKEIWVNESSATGVGHLATSLVNVFSTDASGANPKYFDSIYVAPPAMSTTGGGAGSAVSGPVAQRIYLAQAFPAASDLKFTLTVVPTAGNVEITVFAEML